MDCFDKVEELLLAEGYTKEEIPAIMVSLVEQGFDPTGVVLGGIANMLGWLPKKKNTGTTKMADIRGGNAQVDGSGNPKVTTTSQGTPRQGSLLTKKGTAQNFTKGRTPFTGTDPVPAASSPLPKPSKPPAASPGQMSFPGFSNSAQQLRNVTGNPNLGFPGNKSGFAIGDLDSERLARQLTGQQAPKPWWDGTTRPKVRGTRPSVRPPGSPAPVPAWNPTKIDTGGATRVARTNANTRPVQPQAPVPAWTSQGRALNTPKNIPSASGVDAGAVARATLRGSKPTSLFSRIKSLRGGNPAAMALNLASGAALDKYFTQPTSEFLGKQLAKGIVSATGQQKLYPNFYGKQGPPLDIDTIDSIRARDAEAASKAVYGQRTNEVGQQSSRPSSGDPSTWSKGKQQPKPLSTAAKDFDRAFAAARSSGKTEFTWRGKKYNTKLK